MDDKKVKPVIKDETFLLPIWIDIHSRFPHERIKVINKRLEECFSEMIEEIIKTGETIDVQWSINKHIGLKGGGKDEG